MSRMRGATTVYRAVVTGAFGFCLGQGAVVMWPDLSAWTCRGFALLLFPLI